jgi:hypothetical protein
MDNRVLRVLPLTIFGTWFAFKLDKSAEGDFFLDGFVFLFIGAFGLFFFVRTIFRNTKEYKLTRELVNFTPTIVGVCFIALILSIYSYQYRRANAPTLLRASYDGGYNGFWIDFKVSGNYIMANGSGLGQSYFYGTFVIEDSIITLDKENIDNVITSKLLVVRNSKYFLPYDTKKYDSSKANYVTQIDKNGKEIDTEFRFRIMEDNRNK